MKLHIKYNVHLACKVILQEHLEKLNIPYTINGMGEVEIQKDLSGKQLEKFRASLKRYGIEILDNSRNTLVQQIKEIIIELVYMNEKLPDSRISSYIAGRMNLSYSYLSRVFSEATLISIENYLILQRIERVKQLIMDEELTFTEVAWKLNYSSVAHLSNQFKKTTGLTPTLFQKIIARRRSRHDSSASHLKRRP
ncbi:MAG: helix-turn-helix transcriptional regulator [Bacteroidales bacterium]